MAARKPSLFRQLLWAATLATGFGTVWLMLAAWLGTAIQDAWQDGKRDWPPREELVVRSDGTPLILSTPWENLSLATYRDLNDRVQDAPDRNDLLPAVYMPGEHGTTGFFSARPGWEHRLKVFVDEQEPTVNWFFVHDGRPEGGGYFVGYERASNRRVGFIGLSGFHSDPVPTDERIPVRGALIIDYSLWSSAPILIDSGRWWVPRLDHSDVPPRRVYVPSGNHLRLVDLAARTVKTVFEAPEPIESPGIPSLSSFSSGHPMKEQPILVRTRQQIHALDHKHNVIKVFTIPTEADRQGPVYWYEIGNGQAVADFVRPWSTGEADNVTKRMVYRIADDGAIQDRFELTLQTGSPVRIKQHEAVQLTLALPAPAMLLFIEPLFVMLIDQAESNPAAVSAMLKSSWPSLMAVFALSLVLAIMAWRRNRAFGLPNREQVAWVVFVLLFGVPAYAGFLLHRRWPIRQKCPNCHAQSPRDRAACAECGTCFPDPAKKGIEIFA
ncbi:MAG: hypothetical protein ACHRXM_36105 [Isosphaerales bacterium]